MKYINFDLYSEMIAENMELLDRYENITIVADRETTEDILTLVDLELYDEKSIDFDDECDTYYISKAGESFFCIEPAYVIKDDGSIKYLYSESEYVVINDDLLDEEEISEYCLSEIQYIKLSYDRYDYIDKDYNCTCDNCKEEDMYEEISNTINDYCQIISNSDSCPNCIENILTAFLNDVIEITKSYDFDEED